MKTNTVALVARCRSGPLIHPSDTTARACVPEAKCTGAKFTGVLSPYHIMRVCVVDANGFHSIYACKGLSETQDICSAQSNIASGANLELQQCRIFRRFRLLQPGKNRCHRVFSVRKTGARKHDGQGLVKLLARARAPSQLQTTTPNQHDMNGRYIVRQIEKPPRPCCPVIPE